MTTFLDFYSSPIILLAVGLQYPIVLGNELRGQVLGAVYDVS